MADVNGTAVWERYAPFIREFIYSHGWQSLHEVQLEAAHVLFDTEDNLLLPSTTASGKTEAAFFPILSEFYEDPPRSVGALYIAPLKTLINDQFGRITELTEEVGIPVWHWHGDVAASHKTKLLKNPGGILQITPESLESMLMRRGGDVVRLFADLRYVVIDEIHTLTGSDRGNQILCLLSRLQRMIGKKPRRIGLSATIGDARLAAEWLGADSGRSTYVPELPPARVAWRLGMEHFYVATQPSAPPTGGGKYTAGVANYIPIDASQFDAAADVPSDEEVPRRLTIEQAAEDPGYAYVYDATKGRKALVFSNSREETEYLTATLRQIAEARGERDVFLIHHGNLSASLREEAEAKMKDDAENVVTCATVTMELGIDIGRLERVVQMGSPNSVSSFLQRLGRSGRRGDPPEMLMVFREENPLPNAPLPQLMPWELLKAIAVVQLYLEERFIEPPAFRRRPYSLLLQQTLAILSGSGAMTPRALAERVLSLPPFAEVTKEEYKTLLTSMLQEDLLEMTEEGELLPGLMGERLTASFKFFAVFKDSEDFTVRCESDEIGTITTPPPVGDRFALAGRVWEVEELDIPRKLIYVKAVKGKMEVAWPGDAGEVHTKILRRMREVLREDTEYPYLCEGALKRLRTARAVARATGLCDKPIVHLGGYTWALFPWLGTRSFRTLRKYILTHSSPYRLSGMEYEGSYYMMFRLEGADADGVRFWEDIESNIRDFGIDTDELVGPSETPCFEKYDNFVPGELLRLAYRDDKLRVDEITKDFA